ncbi:hypothetical protein [Vibrio sagamiensis]|uniref:Uncharacterized protein n=1 Tax=Vibrio sagamiensis NBRC 104589 TaxID=1219064 RepID=A0A511QG90_9VIBR|nr:hypothetical protein [Vibrio sagamiensis]GEM76310.1 hypothetical protein VSA01S_24220 [Vibrio sagamiensis NBRC 104589]
MSLGRHGDFAPIMLTNELDETDISSSKLLPKDEQHINAPFSSAQGNKQAKTPFWEKSASKAVKIH